MKNIFIGTAIIFLLGCSKEEKGIENPSAFSLSVSDTLMVDAGEEFLFLRDGLNTSCVGRGGKYLYNYNANDNAIEVIDLDSLILEKKIIFEAEGPNGTGNYVAKMDYLSDNLIVISEYHQLGLFNADAEKTFQLKIMNQPFKGDTLGESEAISPHMGMEIGVLDETGTYFFTTYEENLGGVLGLVRIHLKDKILKKIPIPALKEIEKFTVTLFLDGVRRSQNPPELYINFIQGDILISNNVINEVYVYDVQKDSIKHQSFVSTLTSNSRNDKFQNRADSPEEMFEMIMETRKEITFYPFVYDKKHKLYYRFSKELEKETPGKNIFKSVLTIFDDNLNQIYETDELPIEEFSSKYFVKDGNIYLFENVEDEMGFIVMEVNEI